MRITRVETLSCEGGWRIHNFVKMSTGTPQGLVGYSECTAMRTAPMLTAAIRHLGSRVVGESPDGHRGGPAQAVRHHAAAARRSRAPGHLRDRRGDARPQGQGSRRSGLPAPGRQGARPRARLLYTRRAQRAARPRIAACPRRLRAPGTWRSMSGLPAFPHSRPVSAPWPVACSGTKGATSATRRWTRS